MEKVVVVDDLMVEVAIRMKSEVYVGCHRISVENRKGREGGEGAEATRSVLCSIFI